MSVRLPSVTVVIVTRDRPLLLADALASVAAQTVAPLEVRIGDDGTSSVLENLPEFGLLEVTLIPVAAGQPGLARNRAAAGARGEVLAFLDDDDRWTPEHLAGLAAAFTAPEVEFVWRDSAVIRERVDAEGRRHELERQVIARDWDDRLMHTNDYLPPSSWGVRRTLFEQLGGFDPAFRCSEDWDFALRAAAVTVPRRAPGVTVEVRMREEGHASLDFGPERRACLVLLEQRHGLPPLDVKTFWEVARTVNAPTDVA